MVCARAGLQARAALYAWREGEEGRGKERDRIHRKSNLVVCHYAKNATEM